MDLECQVEEFRWNPLGNGKTVQVSVSWPEVSLIIWGGQVTPLLFINPDKKQGVTFLHWQLTCSVLGGTPPFWEIYWREDAGGTLAKIDGWEFSSKREEKDFLPPLRRVLCEMTLWLLWGGCEEGAASYWDLRQGNCRGFFWAHGGCWLSCLLTGSCRDLINSLMKERQRRSVCPLLTSAACWWWYLVTSSPHLDRKHKDSGRSGRAVIELSRLQRSMKKLAGTLLPNQERGLGVTGVQWLPRDGDYIQR